DTPVTDVPLAARSRPWGSLPGTRLEMERVSKSYCENFPDSRPPRLLSGAAGDKPGLQRELATDQGGRRWRYLPLAPPALSALPPRGAVRRRLRGVGLLFADPQEERTFGRNPLLSSGLVLAGANRSSEDGLLRAEEAAGLDLRGAELVVLSACDTGRGKVSD